MTQKRDDLLLPIVDHRRCLFFSSTCGHALTARGRRHYHLSFLTCSLVQLPVSPDPHSVSMKCPCGFEGPTLHLPSHPVTLLASRSPNDLLVCFPSCNGIPKRNYPFFPSHGVWQQRFSVSTRQVQPFDLVYCTQRRWTQGELTELV